MNLFTRTSLAIITKCNVRKSKTINEIQRRCRRINQIIIKSIQKNVFEIMKTLIIIRYIYDNARRRHNSIDYVFIIIKTIKSTQFFVYNQLYFIYNELKIEFRRNLIISIENIIMNELFRKLKIKKKYDEI